MTSDSYGGDGGGGDGDGGGGSDGRARSDIGAGRIKSFQNKKSNTV